MMYFKILVGLEMNLKDKACLGLSPIEFLTPSRIYQISGIRMKGETGQFAEQFQQP